MGDIHRLAGGRVAAGEGIVRLHGQGLGVEGDQFILVLDIDEDGAGAVSGGRFRLAAQRHAAHRLARRHVNGGGIAAAAVEGEDAVGGLVIHDAVGILSGARLTQLLEALGVEDRNLAGAAFADIGLAADESGAVNARQAGDVVQHLAGIDIHHHQMAAAGDPEIAGGRIHVEIVEAAIAAQRDALDDVITGTGGQGRQGGGAEQRAKNGTLHGFLRYLLGQCSYAPWG